MILVYYRTQLCHMLYFGKREESTRLIEMILNAIEFPMRSQIRFVTRDIHLRDVWVTRGIALFTESLFSFYDIRSGIPQLNENIRWSRDYITKRKTCLVYIPVFP